MYWHSVYSHQIVLYIEHLTASISVLRPQSMSSAGKSLSRLSSLTSKRSAEAVGLLSGKPSGLTRSFTMGLKRGLSSGFKGIGSHVRARYPAWSAACTTM